MNNAAHTKKEVVRTWYDQVMADASVQAQFSAGGQKFLRRRVASVANYSTLSGVITSSTPHTSAVHYSYDQHGNVTQSIQDVPDLDPLQMRLKTTKYEFELISGNVKTVKYQPGKIDQLTHSYYYDKANRLTEVFASRDGKFYDRQAHYWYYDHGPLARTEIGQKKVQGMDYGYTINGWLKYMNGTQIGYNDAGHDGATDYPMTGNSVVHDRSARDVLAWTLGYFDGDYSPIGSSGGNPELNYGGFASGLSELYNGNIAWSTIDIPGFDRQASLYRYDQLNRLKSMNVYRDGGTIGSQHNWSGANAVQDYHNSYTYDANGNIQTLLRKGTSTVNLNMDNLDMTHYDIVGGVQSNRLSYVGDAVSSGTYNVDVDDQTNQHFTYDKMGRLISEPLPGNNTASTIINWRQSDSKVASYVRLDYTLEFTYDAFGRRIKKTKKPANSLTDPTTWTQTYYSYDANGQLMAVYNLEWSANHGNPVYSTATLSEHHVYGASRLGIVEQQTVVFDDNVLSTPGQAIFSHEVGEYRYEITNHLGNVNVVVTDNKQWSTTGSYYEAEIVMKVDYYPPDSNRDGMEMPGRNVTTDDYRFAYNGMEADNDVRGDGNSYTTEFRQYDPRLGRWLSLDPLMSQFPWMSPYVAFDDNPVFLVDPLGLSAGGPGNPPTLTGNEQEGDLSDDGNWIVTKGEDGELVYSVLHHLDEFEVSAKSQSTKRADALARIDVFANSNPAYVHFPEISQRQLANDLRSLVNNPDNTKQLPNTCGLSAAQHAILQDNPEQFVDFVINVYTQQNEHLLAEDGVTKIGLDRDEFNDLEPEGNTATWIFQGTVRNTYNEFYDYDPRESSNDQVAGITTPNEVIALMKSFGFELVGKSTQNEKVVNSRTIMLIDWRGSIGMTAQWHYINLTGTDGNLGNMTIDFFDTGGNQKMMVQTGMGFNPLPKVQMVMNFKYVR